MSGQHFGAPPLLGPACYRTRHDTHPGQWPGVAEAMRRTALGPSLADREGLSEQRRAYRARMREAELDAAACLDGERVCVMCAVCAGVLARTLTGRTVIVSTSRPLASLTRMIERHTEEK